MKVLIIGDTHFHNWSIPQLNWYQEDFLNKILPDVVKASKPDIIVFLGDIFESKSYVDKKVLNLVFSSFELLSRLVPRIYVVVGNHDYYSLSEGPAIDFLRAFGNITIVDKPSITNNSVPIGFVPWAPAINKEDIEKVVSKSEVVFSHVDIKNLPYNPNIKSVFPKGGLDLSVFSGKLLFNGHYHVPQNNGNVIMVGSIAQMDVSEIGYKKRLILFSTRTKEIKEIPLPHPSYVLVEDPLSYNKMVEENNPHVIPYLNVAKKDGVAYEKVELEGGNEASLFDRGKEEDILTIALESLKNIYSQLSEDRKKLVPYSELEEMVVTSYFERKEQ
jgi:DNA repair exonuclease SbcCD nuclease subunit